MKKDTGGPAWPQEEVLFVNIRGYSKQQAIQMTETLKKNVVAVTEGDRKVEPVSEKTGGLTKRDWFAGKALQGLLAGAGNFVAADFQVRSRNAFEIADAMIAEMRKGEDDQTS